MSDSELEAFKTESDLRLYAASLGYESDRRESSWGNAVMRVGSDKIIIKQDRDGHYVYFSVCDPEDNGSIIDFIQRRTGRPHTLTSRTHPNIHITHASTLMLSCFNCLSYSDPDDHHTLGIIIVYEDLQEKRCTTSNRSSHL